MVQDFFVLRRLTIGLSVMLVLGMNPIVAAADTFSGPPAGGSQSAGTTIISVTIQDSGGTAVANAGVLVHTQDFKAQAFGSSNTSGVALVVDRLNNFKSGDQLFVDVYAPSNGSVGLIPPAQVALGAFTGSAYAAQTLKFKAATKTLTGKVTTSDGVVVANAVISFFNKQKSGFVRATADSTGTYTAKLSGGEWLIHGEMTGEFVSFGQSSEVSFADDATVEQKTQDIASFVRVNATITGKIQTPDGSALPSKAGMSIHSQDLSTGTMINADGTFTLKVPGDKTYSLGYFGQNGADRSSIFGAPAIPPVSIKAGETKDLGTITLLSKTQEIQVKIKNGVAGMMVMAFQPKGTDFNQATTIASDGGAQATLKVLPGQQYGVMVGTGDFGTGDSGSTTSTIKKAIKGGPQFVTAPATLNFEAIDTDATITGRILKATDGSVLNTAEGFLEASSDLGFTGKPVQRGTFSLNVASGHTYTLNPMIPAAGFVLKDKVTVTPTANQTVTADIQLVPTDASLIVHYVDSAGQAIPGLFAHAAALSADGLEISGDFGKTDAASSTTIKVLASKGPYKLNAFVTPDSGYAIVRSSDNYSLAPGEAKSVNIVLKALDSSVSGKITDPDGNPVAGAFVKLDNGDDIKKTDRSPMEQFFETSSQSAKDGSYTIKVVSNQTTHLRAFLPPTTLNSKGWLAPKAIDVSLGSKETKTNVDLQFRKADLAVSGLVTSVGQPVVNALVSGYGDDGAANSVRTDGTGHYAMSLTQNTLWHLVVHRDADNKVDSLSSPVVGVDTTGKSGVTLTQDMSLTLQQNMLTLANTGILSSANAGSVSLGNGMSVQVPANALDTTGATATVAVNPTTEMNNQQGATIVGQAYDVTANVNGSSVTSPNSNLTLTIPIPKELPAGVKPSDLSVVSFDEATGALRHETGLTIDADKGTVTVSVSHMTEFALSVDAQADSTPPADPTAVRVIAKNTKKVLANRLTWTNPTDPDFDHLTIYRSTAAGTLGDKLVQTATSDTSYLDSGLAKKTTYFYTFRAVDTAGNEATTTTQVTLASTKLAVRADAAAQLAQAKHDAAARRDAALAAAGKNKKAKALAKKRYTKDLAAAKKAYKAAIKGF